MLEMYSILTALAKISVFHPDVQREHHSLEFGLYNQKPAYADFIPTISIIHHLKVLIPCFLFPLTDHPV